MMLFGIANPIVRLAVGVAVLAIGIALHRVLLDATGAVVVVIGVVQWVYRSRGGAAGHGLWRHR